jgi:hypothetical protein
LFSEEYFQTPVKFEAPILDWINMRERFNAVGRNPSALDPLYRIMFYCLSAKGSLISGHPAILGSGSRQSLPEAARMNSADIADRAIGRDAVYQSLKQQALELCERHSIWRSTSMEGACCLLMVSFLFNYGDKDMRISRGHISATVHILKELIDDHDVSDRKRWLLEDSAGLCYTVAVRFLHCVAESRHEGADCSTNSFEMRYTPSRPGEASYLPTKTSIRFASSLLVRTKTTR